MADLKREGILFALVGPVGSGKTTLGARLLEEFGSSIRVSVSTTTRAMRPGETQGKSYDFVTPEEFHRRVALNEFFEWEEIHGKFYGTPRSVVEGAIREGYDLLLDIDIRGALSFRRAYPLNTVVVFLIPPSFKVLKQRVLGRAPISEVELATRISTAGKEYEALRDAARSKSNVDYVVINDRLDDTYRTVSGILIGERCRLGRVEIESLNALTVLEESLV